MGTVPGAYIALLASRLPWFLGGAAPAAAGAGYIVISGHSITMIHGTSRKSQLAIDPHRKNIYFRFWLQYHYDAWN